MTDCALYCSADGSRLFIPAFVNGFPGSSRAILCSGWQCIVHFSACQWLTRWFARHIAQRMAVDGSFFHSSTAFTMVCAPYCSVDSSTLLILPLVNGFHDGFRALLLSGWQRIAHSSTCQWLSRRFAHRIALWLAAHCVFLHSLMALPTVRAQYCSADCSRLLILTLVKGFHDRFCAVLLRGWQRIAYTAAHQWLSRRFARSFAQRMAAYCSFFRSVTAFATVCASCCSADGSALHILPLVSGFPDDLRTVLLSEWRPIAHSFSRQWLSRRFTRCIAPRMAAHCSFFHSSLAFPTICAPYCSADGSAFLLLPIVNSFHHGLRAVLLSG